MRIQNHKSLQFYMKKNSSVYCCICVSVEQLLRYDPTTHAHILSYQHKLRSMGHFQDSPDSIHIMPFCSFSLLFFSSLFLLSASSTHAVMGHGNTGRVHKSLRPSVKIYVRERDSMKLNLFRRLYTMSCWCCVDSLTTWRERKKGNDYSDGVWNGYRWFTCTDGCIYMLGKQKSTLKWMVDTQ